MKISSRYCSTFYLYPTIQRRMNRTINCRAPGEIYGWSYDGMKSSIFLLVSRTEFQTRSWLKKYRVIRGSYDGSDDGDDRRYDILLRNFNLSYIHGYPVTCFISRSFKFDLSPGITNLRNCVHTIIYFGWRIGIDWPSVRHYLCSFNVYG